MDCSDKSDELDCCKYDENLVLLLRENFLFKNNFISLVSVKVKLAQSCLTLADPVYYTVHGILQARILEWIAFPFSRGSCDPGIEPRSPTLQADKGEFLMFFSFSFCVRFTYDQCFLIKKQVIDIKLVICTWDFLHFTFNNFLKIVFLCSEIFTETFSKASEEYYFAKAKVRKFSVLICGN